MSIDWRKIAEQNGLTHQEFTKEIFSVAGILGAMKLDERSTSENEAIRFTCSDGDGEIEVYIRRKEAT